MPPTPSLLPESDILGWSLRGLRTLQGDETPHFQATLYYQGKAVAHCENDGNGGECEVVAKNNCTVDPWEMLQESARQLPPMKFFGESLPHDACSVVCTLAVNSSMLKEMRRRAKRGAAIISQKGLPVADDGYVAVPLPPDGPEIRQWLETNAPEGVVLNRELLR